MRYALDTIGDGLRKVWTAGKDVTINESMINYMGHAIAWVQHMPAKPINHGIKVFCICYAVSGIILAFNIYCGRNDKTTDGTTIQLCDILITTAVLTGAQGCTLYTDNYYTLMSVLKHLYNEYRWTCVGTIVPTEKNEWAAQDISSLKLSNGAQNMVKRGWYCKTVLKLKAEQSNQAYYYIQCTMWKDKKQDKFLSNNNVDRSVGIFMKGRVRGKKTKDVIPGPRSHADNVEIFNSVDRNDRDSADYSTTIWTSRYYIQIFCWALDRVIHTALCYCFYPE